jgi:hypothetical protein
LISCADGVPEVHTAANCSRGSPHLEKPTLPEGMATACRYQARPQLSSRAARGLARSFPRLLQLHPRLRMPRIVIEEDHFLKIIPVVLDPATPPAHRQAVAEFFAHDEPDFLDWCGRLQERLAGLYPAEIVFARDQADLAAKIADADGVVVVESLVINDAVLAGARRLAVVQKFGTITANIDLAACAARRRARDGQP